MADTLIDHEVFAYDDYASRASFEWNLKQSMSCAVYREYVLADDVIEA